MHHARFSSRLAERIRSNGGCFKYGYCNLAATGASGGRYDGLYVERDISLIEPLLLDIRMDLSDPPKDSPETQTYYVHRGFVEAKEVNAAAINKRAWVLQERLMSPRTLHFCSNQVVFECCATYSSERSPKLIRHNDRHEDFDTYPHKNLWASMQHESNSPNVAAEFWENVIRHYTTLHTTMETDRLVAVSGIAKLVQSHLKNQDYVAGFWSGNLLQSLLWRPDIRLSEPDPKQKRDYVAPSWSWMSAKSKINPRPFYLENQAIKQPAPLARILSYGATPVGDPLGQINDGYLKIQGALAKGLIGVPFDIEKWGNRFGKSDKRIEDPVFVPVAAYFDTNEELDFEEINCLPFFKFSNGHLVLPDRDRRYADRWSFSRRNMNGLLLVKTGSRPGEFRRCGTFESRWRGRQMLEDALANGQKNAAGSGLPYEMTKNGNEFVITIF